MQCKGFLLYKLGLFIKSGDKNSSIDHESSDEKQEGNHQPSTGGKFLHPSLNELETSWSSDPSLCEEGKVAPYKER